MAPKSLLCEDVDGLEEIRLVEYRRYWGGAFKEIEVRKASDIFAALAAREQELGSKGRLVGAVFKVKFTELAKGALCDYQASWQRQIRAE